MGSPFILANKFHTCSLRCVFVHVHAAAKNVLDFLRCFRSELCEAIFDSLKRGYPTGYPLFSSILLKSLSAQTVPGAFKEQ